MALKLSEDGEYAYDVLDEYTGEPIAYKRVGTWLDNTPMTDSKCDGKLYRKINGSYYKRPLKNGAIDMGMYLRNDGSDNTPRWAAFNAYMHQATSLFYLTLIVPQGAYYHSSEIDFIALRYTIEFKNAIMVFAKNTVGFKFRKVYNDYYKIVGLRMMVMNRDDNDPDGLVDVTSASYRQFLNENFIPLTMRHYTGYTLESVVNQAPGTMGKSLNPLDYKYHGIFSSTIVLLEDVRISNFSGHGIFFWGKSIAERDTMGPDGYDCSMAYVEFGVLKNCGGHGFVALGADANQISVERVDARENRLSGFYDASQSGTQFWGCHAAVNYWGQYWIVCNGDATVAGCYAEVNGTTSSIFNGACSVYGGPHNEGFTGSYDSWVQRGANIGRIAAGRVGIGDALEFGVASNRFNLASFRNIGFGGNINIRVGIGGESINQGLMEVVQTGQTMLGGRPAGLPGFGTGGGNAATYENGMMRVGVDNFTPPTGTKYRRGDELRLRARFRQQHLPSVWECISPGLWGGDTYAALCGKTLTLLQPQLVQLSGPTNFIELGDTLILGGQVVEVVGVQGVDGDGNIRTFSISQNIQFPAGTMPEYPRAKFAVKGELRGEAGLRPGLQAGGDIGTLYIATDSGLAASRWNGSAWQAA